MEFASNLPTGTSPTYSSEDSGSVLQQGCIALIGLASILRGSLWCHASLARKVVFCRTLERIVMSSPQLFLDE